MGLWYSKDIDMSLTAYADVNHAGCHDTRRSTSGSAQFLWVDNLKTMFNIQETKAHRYSLPFHKGRPSGEKESIPRGLTPREPTFQVVLDAIALTPCYPAFLITVDVPEVYMHQFWNYVYKHDTFYRFKLDKKNRFKLTLEVFRDIFQICPRVPGRDFDAIPSEEDTMSFLKELGHTGEINSLNDVVDQMWKERLNVQEIWLNTTNIRQKKDLEYGPLKSEGKIYRAILPECLTSPVMKESKSYKTYLGYATCAVPPKMARKFKKASLSKKDSVVIREDHVETKSKSKEKEKVDVTRGKGIDLLFEVALTEEAHMKEVRKKRLRDFHKTHLSGSGIVFPEKTHKSLGGNDEDDNNNEQKSSNEGSEQETESDEQESDLEQEEESEDDDQKNEEYYREILEEKPTVRRARVRERGRCEGLGYQRNGWWGSVGRGVGCFCAVRSGRWGLLRDIAAHSDAEIVSPLEVHVHHEVPRTQEPTLLIIPVSVITESSPLTLAKFLSPYSTYEAASTLTEFELKKILIDKMEKSESYLAAPEHRDCYDSLKKSYDLNKYFFFSYDVYSLKRGRKDKLRDEDPSTGLDRGLKKRKISKDAEPTTKEPVFEVADSNMPQDQEGNPGDNDDEPRKEDSSRRDWFKKPTPPQEPTDLDWHEGKTPQKGPTQNWLMTLAAFTSTDKSLKDFDELMSTPIDFSGYILNGLKIKNLT
ncbi:hypothetical protein Tco_1321543 [Tanacetum coccineum]